MIDAFYEINKKIAAPDTRAEALVAAAEAWRQGIEQARENGDKQAEKEMTVFLRRLG